jgi:glycosyltransferase involved in cell wall biosynthesis
LNTIAALRNLGHDVDAVWTGGWPRRIPHHNLHQLLELPRWFRRVVLEKCSGKRYDVVEVNQPHAWLAAKAFREARLPGVFVNRSHGWESRSWEAVEKFEKDTRHPAKRLAAAVLRRFLARHNRLVTRYSDGIVVETEGDRDAVLSEGGCRDVLVLPPGIAGDFLEPLPPPDPARFRRVIHAASFSSHKAPEVVAAAMRRLARETDFELTWIAQESAHPAIRDLLGDRAGRVRLSGWVPTGALRDLLDRHGFFLQPSYFEGFSLAFVQAMARGGIVLGSEIDCMVQTIRPGESGFLFPPGASDPLAETVIGLASDPARCLAVSRAARAVAEGMTWQKAALRFEEFCRMLLRSKPPQPNACQTACDRPVRSKKILEADIS